MRIIPTPRLHVLYMYKPLQQMSIQLERVLTDSMGATGQVIIRSSVARERDPLTLASIVILAVNQVQKQ